MDLIQYLKSNEGLAIIAIVISIGIFLYQTIISRRNLQVVLDSLPKPDFGTYSESMSSEQVYTLIGNEAVDISQFRASVYMKDKRLLKAAQKLFKQNKIDLVVFTDDVQKIHQLFIVKGLLPPSLRNQKRDFVLDILKASFNEA